MSDSFEVLKHLQADNERLRAEIDSVRKEAAKHRKAKAELQKTLDENVAEVEKWKGEHSKVSKKLESLPTEKDQEIARLQGEIRTRDHKAKFSKVAEELKVRPEAIDDAFNFAWKPESDEVDEAAMKEALTGLLEKKPYLRAEEQAPRRPVQLPGGGQGGKVSDAPGHFTATAEQLKDYAFVRANRDKIIVSTKNGTFHREPSLMDLAVRNLEG